MSGHSKWSTIKRKKAIKDAHKGAIFTKLAKEITVASRIGGGSSESNFRLRLAIQKAKEANMPNNNIERAIKRGTGETGESLVYEEFVYEGYGPGGVAILVDVMTDNRNRASSTIRFSFNFHGGNLGESGCVSWIFETKGLLIVEPKNQDVEASMLDLIDLGIESVNEDEEGNLEVLCSPQQFEKTKLKIMEAGFRIVSSEITKIPQSTVKVTDSQTAGKLLRLLEDLEENEDVQRTHANFDISEEVFGGLNS